MDRVAGRWSVAIVAIVVTATVAALGVRAALMGAGMGLDYNEGWNAFQVRTLLSGSPLYTSPEAFTGNNYPPLSFLLVAALAELGMPVVTTGRLLAFASLVLTGALIFVAVRRLLPDRPRAAWFSLLMFAAYNVTIFRFYVGIYDPQWLGQLAMAGALVLLLGAPTQGRLPLGRVLVAGLLVTAGALVKHNIVAVPLAAAAWMALHDRRALVLWCGLGIAAAGAMVVADRTVFSGHMLASIMAGDRRYSLERLFSHGALVLAFVPAIFAAWPVLVRRAVDRRFDLLIIGTVISLAAGLGGSAGDGVDVNAWFDALIFLSIAAPVGVALRGTKGAAARWLALTPAVVLLPWSLWLGAGELAQRSEKETATSRIVARIAQQPGRVACQTLIYCYWAGQDFEMDFHRVRQRLIARGHGAAIRATWHRRGIGGVLVKAPRPGAAADPLGPLLRQDFSPAFSLDGQILLTKRWPGGAPTYQQAPLER